MTEREIKNVAASVRARLLNHARANGTDFQLVLRQFFFERFLYRLSKSPSRQRFVLKGAILLRLWSGQPYRATVDLDLLRRGESSRESILDDLRELFDLNVKPDDGVRFATNTIRIDELRADEEYLGFRVTFVANLDSIRDRLQIDLGTGDAAWPRPTTEEYPTILDLEPPKILAYQKESVVAEKLHAIVKLGMKNSRIKDYFDLHYLASTFAFEGEIIRESVERTFERRATAIPTELPVGLTSDYWKDSAREAQLRAFARRARLDVNLASAETLIPLIRRFADPMFEAIGRKEGFAASWMPGGPWRSKD